MSASFKTLYVLIALAVAGVAVAADVTGTWAMNLEMQGNTATSIFMLQQDGGAIKGKYQGQLGEASVTGSVNGDEFVLTYRVEAQGVPLDVTYTGTVSGETMRGKFSIAGFGDGTFVGAKK